MLTERQQLILQLIIRLYTEYQEPIGSQTVLQVGQLPYSSATIRNEMMKLEEMGYLEKTHLSSGRIPSISGYRYYVDNMLPAIPQQKVAPRELQNIRSALRNRYHEVRDIVDMSAQMLSHLTNYTTIVLGPETKQSRLTGFRLVPLNDTQVMAIIVTDKGFVENRIFNKPPAVSNEDIEKIVHILNAELVGLRLSEVYYKLQRDIPMLIRQNISAQFDILPIVNDLMARFEGDRLFVAGKMNLFDFIDSQRDKERLKHIYHLMENTADLYNLVTPIHDGVDVKIGSEIDREYLHDLSFVTTTYQTQNGPGIIALLGPANMSYDRVISLMNTLSEELTDTLNQYFSGRQ